MIFCICIAIFIIGYCLLGLSRKITTNTPWITNIGVFESTDWCYAKNKTIGVPKATDHYTVVELKKMGVVGLYGEVSN